MLNVYIYIYVYLPTISCNIFWYRDKHETLPPKHWPATWHFCQLPVKQHPNADPQHRIVPQRLRTTHGIGTIPVCSLVLAPRDRNDETRTRAWQNEDVLVIKHHESLSRVSLDKVRNRSNFSMVLNGSMLEPIRLCTRPIECRVVLWKQHWKTMGNYSKCGAGYFQRSGTTALKSVIAMKWLWFLS